MNKKGEFDEESAKILLKEIKYEEETRKKYKRLFEANKRIRKLIEENKLCEESLQAILGIFCQIRIIEFIYTILPEKDRKNFQTSREGFKSDTEFFGFVLINQTLEIEEREIKIKVAYILEDFLKELKKIEKRKRKL